MKQTRISLAIGENGKFSCAVLSGAVFYCCAAVATNCANVFECVPFFLLLPIFLFQHPSPFCYTFWRSSFVLQFALSLRSPPTQLPTLPPLCGTQTRTFKEGKSRDEREKRKEGSCCWNTLRTLGEKQLGSRQSVWVCVQTTVMNEWIQEWNSVWLDFCLCCCCCYWRAVRGNRERKRVRVWSAANTVSSSEASRKVSISQHLVFILFLRFAAAPFVFFILSVFASNFLSLVSFFSPFTALKLIHLAHLLTPPTHDKCCRSRKCDSLSLSLLLCSLS